MSISPILDRGDRLLHEWRKAEHLDLAVFGTAFVLLAQVGDVVARGHLHVGEAGRDLLGVLRAVLLHFAARDDQPTLHTNTRLRPAQSVGLEESQKVDELGEAGAGSRSEHVHHGGAGLKRQRRRIRLDHGHLLQVGALLHHLLHLQLLLLHYLLHHAQLILVGSGGGGLHQWRVFHPTDTV